MWAIANQTPLSADRTWVRDRDGSEVWLVAVKATFLVRQDGSVRLAPKQEPVCLTPAYIGEPGASSLRYDTDLVHRKRGTDVIVHGCACARPQSRVSSVKVGFRVGELAKELIVFGDRVWRSDKPGIPMTEPEPFECIPITWERAFGGYDGSERKTWDVRNPVGVGFMSSISSGAKLPNVEDPCTLIRSWADKPVPAGFGPIDRHWAPRSRFGGTYDEVWERNRKPLVPEDFDDRYHQCAPADQQVAGFLRGGEQVDIWNMTPGGHLRFQLPRAAIGFETRFADNSVANHRGELHAVILEPSVRRVIMVWHSHLPCHSKVHKLLETSVVLKRPIKRPNSSIEGFRDYPERDHAA